MCVFVRASVRARLGVHTCAYEPACVFSTLQFMQQSTVLLFFFCLLGAPPGGVGGGGGGGGGSTHAYSIQAI